MELKIVKEETFNNTKYYIKQKFLKMFWLYKAEISGLIFGNLIGTLITVFIVAIILTTFSFIIGEEIFYISNHRYLSLFTFISCHSYCIYLVNYINREEFGKLYQAENHLEKIIKISKHSNKTEDVINVKLNKKGITYEKNI